jgi:hypothetical protein
VQGVGQSALHKLHSVRPGHPFFTEQLDRQREEQRLILAGIQERTLEAVGIDRAKPVHPEPTGRVETTVRRLAGSLIAALPARVLEVVALPVEKQALGAWASEVDWSGWPNHVVKMVADEARTSSDDEPYVDQLMKRHDDALGRLAALLVWADDLAEDYLDPRIRAWRDQM